MIKNSIKLFISGSLLLSLLFITSVLADEQAGLIKFIKNNTLESIKTDSNKEEELQILVSSSTDKDIKKIKAILDNKNSTLEEKKLAVKALGLKKDNNSSVYLRDILLNTKNKDLLYLSAWGLLEIGGNRNYILLVEQIDKLRIQLGDNDLYYKLLANLAYKYKSDTLLGQFSSYLKENPDNNMKAVYLYSIFGNNFSSVLSLNNNLNSSNKNVKNNAAEILGKWYTAEAAIIRFRDIILTSNDSKLRQTAINGLAQIGNLYARKELQLVLKTAKTEEEKTLATRLIKELDNIIIKAKKNRSKSVEYHIFRNEYSKLLNSKGFYGSYELMAQNAKFTDISKLEKLRETIMLNLSENAAINCLKVNQIIRDLRIKKEFSK